MNRLVKSKKICRVDGVEKEYYRLPKKEEPNKAECGTPVQKKKDQSAKDMLRLIEKEVEEVKERIEKDYHRLYQLQIARDVTRGLDH